MTTEPPPTATQDDPRLAPGSEPGIAKQAPVHRSAQSEPVGAPVNMPPLFRWRGLRSRIILWSFVPTTIILVAAAFVTYFAYQQLTQDLVTGRNRELVRLSATQLSFDLGQYSEALAAVGRTTDISHGDPATQRAALKRPNSRLGVFDGGVVLLTSRGAVVAAEPERPDLIGTEWSGQAFFRGLFRSNGGVYSDIVSLGPGGSDAIAVAVPVVGDQGELVGALVGLFQLGSPTVSSFYGSIVKLRATATGITYVIDGTRRVVYHPDPERVGEEARTAAVRYQAATGQANTVRTTDFDGRDVLVSYAPIPGTSWGLVTQEDWRGIMTASEGYGSTLAVLLVLGLVAPTVVLAVGLRRITQPINDLIAAAKEVSAGNFGRTLSAPTGDEIEELAEQFNLMSARLQESYANLERRVIDRTRELATINGIAGIVSRTLDLEEILRDSLDRLLEVMNGEVGVAFRVDDATGDLLLVAHRGIPEEAAERGSRLKTGEGASAVAAQRWRPIFISVEDYPPGGIREVLIGEGVKFMVSVPLIARGKFEGTISIGWRTKREPSASEMSLLAAIGQQIGVAVENARIYERAEESAAAAERNRLARDLHDAVSQTLFSASLIAEVLPKLWERDPEEGRRRLQEIRQLTRGALAEMRTLLLELRPAALSEAALPDLLRQLGEAVTGRSRVPVTIEVDGQLTLPPDTRIALYRIAQESLNNVAKHSGATQAAVRLTLRPGRVALNIIDDGRGFDPASVPGDHLGLRIMRERADAIGAVVTIASEPGEGTEVSVEWLAKS